MRTYWHRNKIGCEGIELLYNRKFQLFVRAIITAYITTLARCAYRISELSDGWRSELMRDEVEFIVLEGAMIVTTVAVLTVFNPGYCSPVLATSKRSEGPKSMTDVDEGIKLHSLARLRGIFFFVF